MQNLIALSRRGPSPIRSNSMEDLLKQRACSKIVYGGSNRATQTILTILEELFKVNDISVQIRYPL